MLTSASTQYLRFLQEICFPLCCMQLSGTRQQDFHNAWLRLCLLHWFIWGVAASAAEKKRNWGQKWGEAVMQAVIEPWVNSTAIIKHKTYMYCKYVGSNETGKPKALGFGTKTFLVQQSLDLQWEALGCSQALWLLGYNFYSAKPPVTSHAGRQLAVVRTEISYQFLFTVIWQIIPIQSLSPWKGKQRSDHPTVPHPR